MTTDNELLGTTDARVWAEAFCELFGNEQIDVNLMTTWFACAIETGRDSP